MVEGEEEGLVVGDLAGEGLLVEGPVMVEW